MNKRGCVQIGTRVQLSLSAAIANVAKLLYEILRTLYTHFYMNDAIPHFSLPTFSSPFGQPISRPLFLSLSLSFFLSFFLAFLLSFAP
jgi:hypothetical protein